jgi:hypothetical protein
VRRIPAPANGSTDVQFPRFVLRCGTMTGIHQTNAGAEIFWTFLMVAFVINGLAQNPTLRTKPNVT